MYNANLREIAKQYAETNNVGLPLTTENLLNAVVNYVKENTIVKDKDVLLAIFEDTLEGSDTIVVDLNEEGTKYQVRLDRSVVQEITGKQDKLTFDNIPIDNSTNPVTSGGVYTALEQKQDELTWDDYPVQGSEDPVTSGGLYATFQGKQDKLTFDTTPTEGSTNPVTSEGIKAYVDEHGGGSGVSFDNVPTEGSQNAVRSNGIYEALQTKQNTLSFDTTPTEGSTNPVTSEGIKAYVDEHGGGGGLYLHRVIITGDSSELQLQLYSSSSTPFTFASLCSQRTGNIGGNIVLYIGSNIRNVGRITVDSDSIYVTYFSTSTSTTTATFSSTSTVSDTVTQV